MDDFVHEEVSDRGSKRKSKSKSGLYEEEEAKDSKILVDILPQTQEEITTMMKDVTKEIKKLELKFFEEEQSDSEKTDMDPEN